MNRYVLHKVIGDCIKSIELPGCKIFMDSECGGQHIVPLYCSTDNSKENKYCEVDILILKDNKIRVIVEIEESNKLPTQIFGKFFASAFSSYFIHESKNKEPKSMSDSVLFIHILDKSKLKEDKTSKIRQGENIEKSIGDIIPISGSKIDNYRLFYEDIDDYDKDGDKRQELVSYIEEFLK